MDTKTCGCLSPLHKISYYIQLALYICGCGTHRKEGLTVIYYVLYLFYNITNYVLQYYVLYFINYKNVKSHNEDFPGDAVVKNPPANAGDTGSIPGPGRSHMPQSN